MTPVLEHILRGALGMVFLIAVCYVLSNNRQAIDWKLVIIGVVAQVMFAMGVLSYHVRPVPVPVFWVLAGALFLYLAYEKIKRTNKLPFSEGNRGIEIALGLLWQVAFVFLVVRSGQYTKPGLSLLIGFIIIFLSIKYLSRRNAELIKWSTLISVLLLTTGVFAGWCSPDVFRNVLTSVSDSFVSLINLSHAGTEFLFGELARVQSSTGKTYDWLYVFAIQVLPNIIFFAALSALLYYLGILQQIVFVFAYLLNKLNISGAESVSTSANIFLGQTEAPLMIRPYLEAMNRSEILCVMVGGMANTAGSVLAAYVGMLGGTDATMQHYFALHLLSQSIMSAPAAIVCSKILFPQRKGAQLMKELNVPKEKLGDNVLDAVSLGTTDGLKLAANVGAMLIVFTALMYVLNALMGWVGDITDLNKEITAATGGRYTGLSLQMVLGYIFAPVAWLIGVPSHDMIYVGQLLGEKTILNEFLAYGSFGKMKDAGLITDPKSILITTYALCGFANFASIGIQIGGISQLAPNQRRNLTELGIKALIGGTIACLMCGCIAGALM